MNVERFNCYDKKELNNISNSDNKPVYYLISQEFYGSELHDVINKGEIQEKNTTVVKIDIEDVDNLFEITKEKEEEEEKYVYKIIRIIKQKYLGSNNEFKIDDLIYLDFGMVSFHTKTLDGKIDKISVFPTEIIKKEKILLFSSIVEIKMKALLDLIDENNYLENENYEKIKNYIGFILDGL